MEFEQKDTVTLRKEDVRNDLAGIIAVTRAKHHLKVVGHESCPYRESEERALDGVFRLLSRLEGAV